jgi:decaprenyl-phosphate phosphoribosyltransferase
MHGILVQHTLTSQLRGLIILMRPKQWIKNGFVLAPLIFTGEFLNLSWISPALFATLLFCIASSATYIVNDICDIERDRRHPKKSKTRPLASGVVTVPMAMMLLALLYGTIAWAWISAPDVVLVIVGYLALNLLYTFFLKNIPVIDIFAIAIGFVLRVYAGAVALAVPLSSWMAVTTLCLALYLAAVKRRQELDKNGTQGREVLNKYSVVLIDRYAHMAATGALFFYSLYVMSAKPEMVVTIPLVLFGLFRYWYVVDELNGGESPTDALLADWQLLTTVVLWVGVCAWVLWPGRG